MSEYIADAKALLDTLVFDRRIFIKSRSVHSLPALQAQIDAIEKAIADEEKRAKVEAAAQRKAEATATPPAPPEIRPNTWFKRPAYLDRVR